VSLDSGKEVLNDFVSRLPLFSIEEEKVLAAMYVDQ
jgi:hypothetical protein